MAAAMTTGPDQRYQARGVSAAKSEVHAAIEGQDPGLFPGAFCKIIPDHLSLDPLHCLVMHADGAGTKASLAYLAWMEGFGEGVWEGIAQDSLVMNLDDCGCVGALGPFLISNTIGRNAKRIPGWIIAAIVRGYQRMCDVLQSQGIPCVMTGGETADVGDLVRTIIVDSTVVCRLARAQVVDAARMAPGDVIVGFSSTGRARWETTDQSGIGSNGLTSARHELLDHRYATRYPESFAPEIPADLAYSGSLTLQSPLPGVGSAQGIPAALALLSPTRTYLPLIRQLVGRIPRSQLHGLIHCSGGGQAKIVKFGAPGSPLGNRYVKDQLFPVPPLFAAIQAQAGISWQEMYTVYNLGHRLEAVMAPEAATLAIALSQDCGISAQVVGRVERSETPGNEVVVTSDHGTFRYR
jgi:phosphoribosylformylglycinamidine cyclo-ligase